MAGPVVGTRPKSSVIFDCKKNIKYFGFCLFCIGDTFMHKTPLNA